MVADVAFLVGVQLPLEEPVREPGVLDDLRGSGPLADVAVQHAQHQRLGGLGDLLPEVAAEPDGSALGDVLHDFEVVSACVGGLSREEDIEDDS